MAGSPRNISLGARAPVSSRLAPSELDRQCCYIEPPEDLLNAVFPWVKGEIKALEERRRFAIDIAFWEFIHLLIWLRRVSLQDAVVIHTRYPELSIPKYGPFDTPSCAVAASAASQIELRAHLTSKNLPENIVSTVRRAWHPSRWSKSGDVRQTSLKDKVLAQIEYLTELAATGSAVSLYLRRLLSYSHVSTWTLISRLAHLFPCHLPFLVPLLLC
jgi:hypothetical protein